MMLQRGAAGEVSTASSRSHTVYVIDKWHHDALEHARTIFDKVVVSTDPEFQGWQDKARVVLIRGSHLSAEDIAKSPNLVAVGKHGVGIEKIDEKACAARGIKILNTPGANSQAVAEIVVALALSVARNIPSIFARQAMAGEAVPKATCSGLVLRGKTVGIIGMGNIGCKTAHILQAGFACNIVTYDPYFPAQLPETSPWTSIPHQRVSSYGEMLGDLDLLTVHVPLTDGTRDMIGYKELCSMKSTAIVLNASRGGIINEQDLERALSEGKIWGAGLDAHEQEPPTAERYGGLWRLPNVVSTPHIGAATEDAQRESAMQAVIRLHNYLQSIEPNK